MELRKRSLNLISQAVKRGVSKQELKDAVNIDISLKQSTNFDDLIFPDHDTKERFQESVFNAHNAFINKYPQILKIDTHDMADCDLTARQTHDIIDNIDQHDRHIALSKTFYDRDDDPPEITCGGWGNLGKLLVCNAIASFGCGGPPGLILCGWGCWCMFCQQSTLGCWIC